MTVDMVIEKATVVNHDSTVEADLVIDNGKIIGINRGYTPPSARRIIDARGMHVLPGVVDEHVHLQDMDRSAIANFFEGTTAAAAGGVTKKEAAGKRCIVDFALYGGAVPGNLVELPKMVDAGAVGFKAMMAGSVPGLFEILDDGLLLETMAAIADCESVIALHAENEAIINRLEGGLKRAGKKDIRAFFASRPVIQEVEAISRALMFARETGCRLHVVHVSCPQGIELIQREKEKGRAVYCETGPHYLVLSEEDAERLGPYLKFAPPVRSRTATEALWAKLREDRIDTLGSDHGAHEKENKEKGWGNIWDAGNGALGIETMLPVMLSEGVNKGRISLQQLVSLICTNPARLFGLYPQKGTIQVGSDADLVVVDMKKRHAIRADELHTIQKHTPFDGLSVTGMPVHTIVRGQIVMEDGVVIGKPGYGRFVRPRK
jgi:allantoinase